MKRSPLKRDPVAIRDWVQVSRKPLKRTRKRKSVGPVGPGQYRDMVWELCEGRCVVSGQIVGKYDSHHIWESHHPLPKRHLDPHIRYNPMNGIVLLKRIHERHESRIEVIPFEKLPPYCMEFASELGSWAVEALLRAHPRETK
jgi:hypothetical protein